MSAKTATGAGKADTDRSRGVGPSHGGGRRRKIPIGDATALALIADFPDMPDEEFQELIESIQSSRIKRKAHEIRRISALLREDPEAEVGKSDSAYFVRSFLAGAGQ